VRRAFTVKKVGHAGTLDPLATGVLVLCVGAATRLSEYVLHATKRYLARVHLGVTTDT
jgi:tRNA pseudouridine55 synthase